MMKLSPKTVTGALHSQNKGACDWGWQRQLAYGCYNFVVVLDPSTVQIIQVLGKHTSNVVKVKWARENYQHDLGSPYGLRLATGDASGVIIVWDVAQGQSRSEFSDGNKPIQDLEWLSTQDASHDLLVALHQPYSLILWNADAGTKLWKKSYTETLLSIAFDPFNYKNVAFLGQDCIVFIDDFTITKTPSSNGKKFYISSPSNQAPKAENTTGSLERKSASRNLARKMTKILVGESGKQRNQTDEDTVALNECLQLIYHQSCRHHIILLYSRELLILDLEINQTVGIIPMERTGSPFVQVIPLRQRDVLLCLHENGSIATRVRRKTNVISTPASEGSGAFDDSPPQVSLDVAYDLRCQSDPMRLTRHAKVFAMACCPVTERTTALVMSDSRVILWELMTLEVQGKIRGSGSPLHTPGASLVSSLLDNQGSGNLLVTSAVNPPRMALCDMIGQAQIFNQEKEVIQKGHGVGLKFVVTGLLNGIASPVTVIRMCPPLTTKNWSQYEPLLASGTSGGIIQIVNIASGQIDKEYCLHTSTVRGIEWCSLKSLISFSYPNPAVNGLVKNEIQLLDITTGKSTPVRIHRDQESPLELLRISHLKQYFILIFKDKPFELWDLRTFTILRETGKNLPRPVALEWSPSHSLKTLKRRLFQQQQCEEESDLTASTGTQMGESISTSASTTVSDTGSSELKTVAKPTGKEHFVYTDSDGTLYHFVVEGSGFTDATKIPPESGMGTITWIAWKGDNIAFGDVDGQLCLWDLKSKVSRTTSTHRGWIRKIRFAPGRGNFRFLILYNDGIDVWDVADGKPEQVSSMKCPKDLARVVDVEWAGSDRPVVATADGSIHVLNMSLNKFVSALEEWQLQDEIFCPHMLPSKCSLLMKLIMQNQLWSETYQLSISGLREDDKEMENLINKQLKLLDSDVAAYLPVCKFGTAERCLHVARIFGDESELHFWTVALHYLTTEKVCPMSKSLSNWNNHGKRGDFYIPATPAHKVASDLVVLDSSDVFDENMSQVQEYRDQPLERCYDILCDSCSFQKYQLDRVALHDSKRATYDHTKKCAENYILLGQTDRAVQLLLETEPDNDSYYIDCLRACLVASIRSSGASQSTIKLVATNLIANGKLSEGVQLLCLIEKGLDACRYLQTYGAWDQAVWLAKATLNYTDCCEVMKRWIDHLCGTQVNQKSKAVLVMLSIGQFVKVLEMLYSMRQFSKAACFIQACTEFGVLDRTDETKSLIEAVYLEYARLLINVGHREAAEFYCKQAGEKGNQLIKEVEILFS